MQTIPVPNRIDPRHLPSLIVLLVLITVVPFIEFSGGNVPWREPDASFTRDGIASGKAARVVESRFADDSVVSTAIRPWYNVGLWQLFRITTERVTVGRDGWLFETSNVRNYPRPHEDEIIARHVREIDRLVRWYRGRGTDVVLLCVPNKWAFYPDKLPPLAMKPRAVYKEINAALDARGLEAVDLSTALDPQRGPSFLPNDTHWTDEGARRAAEAVAEAVKQRFADRLPGRSLEAMYLETPDRGHRGDLQRMLGFEEESATDRALLVKKVGIVGVDTATKKRLDGRGEEEIVCCGTSFSHSVDFTSMLAVAMQRAVENRTIAGQGPTKMILELAQQVREGSRAAPELIVWEFPEKHLFTRARDFVEPLEDFLAEAEREDAFEYRTEEPFRHEKMRLVNLEMTGDDGAWLGKPTNGDPQIVFDLEEPLPADGTCALTYSIKVDRRTNTKIILDAGSGLDRTKAITARLGKGRSTLIVLPLIAEGGGMVKRIRLDPVETNAPFELGEMTIRRR